MEDEHKKNYDAQMTSIIQRLDYKPKLLLHSCCAPCSSYCLYELNSHFLITVYYYNPNIDTDDEYEYRKAEQIRFIKENQWINPVEFYGEPHLKQDFYEIIKGKENEKEGGARCVECFKKRLFRTAEFAKANGFDYFTTTLTISPLKNATLLNQIGQMASEKYGVRFLPSDFKKRDGYKKSIDLSRKYELYRQTYCGCKFSKKLD